MENSQVNPPGSRFSRRDLLKVGAAAAAAGAGLSVLRPDVTTRAPLAAIQETHTVKPTCALCPSGCGLEVRVVDGKAVKVEGSALHPLNQGVCCLKGQTSLEMLYSPERLEHPRLQMGERGSGDWKEIPWEEALKLLSEKMSVLRKNGKPHALALITGATPGLVAHPRSAIDPATESY